MVDSSVGTGDKIQFALTAGMLVGALALGGGQGGLGDTFVQLWALGLIGYLFAGSPPLGRLLLSWQSPGWLVLVALAVPLLQALPLPAWIGGGGEQGRGLLVPQLTTVGLTLTSSISVQALAAERALWTLLPGVAIYLSALTMSNELQRRLLGIVLFLAFAGLVLGLMQVADGADSALRLYSNTNRMDAVGFFANRNHLAALLLAVLPLSLAAVAWVISERAAGTPVSPIVVAGFVGLSVMLILGIALTRSRAGLLLGMFGLLLSAPMVLSMRRRRGVKRVFGIILTLSLLLTIQFALFGILQRLQADPLGDQRWQIADLTVEAARQNAPLGSGLGSFRQVFQSFDTQAPGTGIVNHAHNDYLELWLEAGWPFVAAATILIGLAAWAAFGAWRSTDARSSLLAKAASISLLLVLLHSSLDYPLRTTAHQAVFALLLAVLLSWRWRMLAITADVQSTKGIS